MSIVHDAQLALRDLGIDQWQDGYPTRESIVEDIDNGVGYVAVKDDKIIGYAAIVLSGEPAYLQIADKWLYDNNYVVVHRLCTSITYRRKGTAIKLMQHAASISRDAGHRAFRIDTHRGNIRMLSMLEKLGFSYRGIVHYDSGERVAYELNLDLSNTL
ncbi:MAG: GNAT family N-acetyltransferase [Alistipes sp.]|nr:GNAT family N-acetyltransferase [Alistipes sp.]